MPWEDVGPDFMLSWGYPRGKFQPEHLAIYGQTGRGKSHFEKYVLMERARLRGSQVIVVCTKGADDTIRSTGWPVVRKWPPPHGWRHKRRDYDQVIYWPEAEGLNDEQQAQQAAAIKDLMQQLWVAKSNRIIAFDEIAYIEDELGLKTYTSRYLREGRGMGITVVASTQRPAGVSRYMHSETAWSVAFAPKDEDDAERMAQVLGNKLYYRRVLDELDASQFEFVLVHNLTREAVITALPAEHHKIAVARPAQEAPKTRPVVE